MFRSCNREQVIEAKFTNPWKVQKYCNFVSGVVFKFDAAINLFMHKPHMLRGRDFDNDTDLGDLCAGLLAAWVVVAGDGAVVQGLLVGGWCCARRCSVRHRRRVQVPAPSSAHRAPGRVFGASHQAEHHQQHQHLHPDWLTNWANDYRLSALLRSSLRCGRPTSARGRQTRRLRVHATASRALPKNSRCTSPHRRFLLHRRVPDVALNVPSSYFPPTPHYHPYGGERF